MLKTIANGTKEELLVDITDRTGGITSLSGVKFEVYYPAGPSWKVGNGTYAGATAGTNNGMTAIALVDTSTPWTVGTYALYIWFQVGGNNIRKGPYYFDVVA